MRICKCVCTCAYTCKLTHGKATEEVSDNLELELHKLVSSGIAASTLYCPTLSPTLHFIFLSQLNKIFYYITGIQECGPKGNLKL